VETRFSVPVQTGSETHLASCTMGTGSFPGVIWGRGVTLTPHPLLVPRTKIEYSYFSTLPKGFRGVWRGETYLLDRGGWSTPRPGCFTPKKNTVIIVYEAKWAPGKVWTGEENLVHIGIRFPDYPACNETLYRLSYAGSC